MISAIFITFHTWFFYFCRTSKPYINPNVETYKIRIGIIIINVSGMLYNTYVEISNIYVGTYNSIMIKNRVRD